MADRTVRVVLTAATQAFDAAMQRASASAKSLDQELTKVNKVGGFNDLTKSAAALQPKLAEIAASVDKTTAVSNTAMGKLAHTVRENDAALSTMGTAATTVGAAWTALNAVVATTGISYNTLQQTSRAALTTLTGSAREANAQMDKLDAFATTSPFAKDVFITAQQQMLGFGIEAGKVIPYLSAINDATAAMGGNNHTVAELSRIMSQISASAKITATDLREFGNRGIDAATIIGSQMGKTGAQIRDDITAGTLDAQVALDALAAGMSERFAGASANVKNTMAGAFDRVKAAFRDLSAEIVSGAVSPNGGGWLVDWTNGLADLLRLAQQIPDPIKQTAGALSAIGGVSLLATGGVLKLVTAGVEMRDAWTTLSTDSPRLATGIRRVGAAAGIAAASLAALTIAGSIAEGMTAAAKGADDATAALERLRRGTGDLDMLFTRVDGSGLSQSVYDLESALDRFSRRNDALMVFEDLANSLAGVTSQTDEVRNIFAMLDADLTGMDFADAAATFKNLVSEMGDSLPPVEDLVELMPAYAAQVQLMASANGEAELEGRALMDAMLGLHPAVQQVADATGGAVAPVEVLTEKVATLSGAMVEGTEEQIKFWESIGQAGGSFVDVVGAYDQMIEKKQELAQAAADAANETSGATGDMAASWEDFFDGVDVGFDDYMQNLRDQVTAQQEWQSNLAQLAGQISDDVLMALADMGPAAAPLIADLAQQPATVLAEWESLFSQSDLGSALGASLENLGPTIRAATENAGQEAVDALKAKLEAGAIDLPEFEVELNLLARTEEEIAAAKARIENEKLIWDMAFNADTSEADSAIDATREKAEGTPATLDVEADTQPAQKSTDDILAQINASSGEVTIEADPDPARSATQGFLSWADWQRADVTVGADTSAAERATRAALDRISRMSATVQIRAHHANGLHAPVATGGRVGDVAAAYGLAGGGYVRGPGTTTSDEAVRVALSRDEFVIRAWAASRIGASDLYYMNRTGQIPSRPQNIIHRTSTATASTVNNNHEAPQITLAPGAIQIHGLNAVHAVEEFQRELAGRFEQTGGRHG